MTMAKKPADGAPSPTGPDFDRWRDEYENRIGRAVAFSGQSHDFFLRAKADHFADAVRAEFGHAAVKVLDIGCGHGLMHRHMLARDDVTLDITGVDPAANVIEEAKRLNPDVAYSAYDGRRLPYEEGSFDVATATCVMHHVPPARWPEFLGEMRRVVRPRGRLIVYEHNPFNPATQWIVNTCPIDADAVLLRSGVLRRLMRGAGLGAITCQHILFTPFDRALFRKLDRALWWLPLGAQYAVSGTK
jgi:SAM-dependent methyltransferase